jgi:hypothetical protein
VLWSVLAVFDAAEEASLLASWTAPALVAF